VDLSRASVSATFLELGFDSLFLTQASQAVQKRFGAAVSFRQLLEEFSTLEKLAAHLDAQKQGRTAQRFASTRHGAPAEPGRQVRARRILRRERTTSILSRSRPHSAKSGLPRKWRCRLRGLHESCTLRLRGPLHLEALRLAIQQLVPEA